MKYCGGEACFLRMSGKDPHLLCPDCRVVRGDPPCTIDERCELCDHLSLDDFRQYVWVVKKRASEKGKYQRKKAKEAALVTSPITRGRSKHRPSSGLESTDQVFSDFDSPVTSSSTSTANSTSVSSSTVLPSSSTAPLTSVSSSVIPSTFDFDCTFEVFDCDFQVFVFDDEEILPSIFVFSMQGGYYH